MSSSPKNKPKSRPASMKVVITADMLDKKDEAVQEKDDRLPHEVILDDINERHLDEIERDEQYEIRKYLLTFCCFMSSIVGVVLIGYSLGLTVIFYGLPTSVPGLIAAGFFFLPCLVWFFYLYCPHDRKERSMRWAIHERRKAFRQIRDIRYRWSMGIDEEEYQEKKRLDAEEEEEYQRSRGRGSTRKSSARDSKQEEGGRSSVRKSSAVDDSRRQSSFAGLGGESGRKSSVADV